MRNDNSKETTFLPEEHRSLQIAVLPYHLNKNNMVEHLGLVSKKRRSTETLRCLIADFNENDVDYFDTIKRMLSIVGYSLEEDEPLIYLGTLSITGEDEVKVFGVNLAKTEKKGNSNNFKILTVEDVLSRGDDPLLYAIFFRLLKFYHKQHMQKEVRKPDNKEDKTKEKKKEGKDDDKKKGKKKESSQEDKKKKDL